MDSIRLRHYTPKEINDVIRRSVIGQDTALIAVSTALSAHLSRLCYKRDHPGRRICKDNLLIIGNTGTGKTEAIRAAVRGLNLPIPIAVIAVNTLSNVGYKGKSVDGLLEDLMRDAGRIISDNPASYLSDSDYHVIANVRRPREDALNKAIVKLSEQGIVVLDEMDKIRADPSNEHDGAYKRGLQYELLKVVEGSKGIGEGQLSQQIDTTDILFVAAGAFTGLLKPPAERPGIGFGRDTGFPAASEADPERIPSTAELAEFGLVDELLGRFPLRCRFRDLSISALYKILTESDVSPVHDFKRLFEATGNNLEISDSALREVARQAAEIQTGARGLRTVLSAVLYPLLYEIDGSVKEKEITITPGVIAGRRRPVIKRKPDIIDAAINSFNVAEITEYLFPATKQSTP